MAEADKTRQKRNANKGTEQPPEPLTVEQLNAVDLLVTGQPDATVAAAVGVSRQTVCDWRNHNPWFAAELGRRRRELWSETTRRLQDMAVTAVDRLQAALDDPTLSLPAAVHILKAVGLYGAAGGPVNEPTTPEAALRRQAEQDVDDIEAGTAPPESGELDMSDEGMATTRRCRHIAARLDELKSQYGLDDEQESL
jgi:hypothetical protein